jgi:hypothetical protein
MNRLVALVSALLLGLFVIVPVAAAASPTHRDNFVVTSGGDVTLAPGEQTDLLVVIDGTATIQGEAKAVVVVNGTANFVGSHTGAVYAVQSTVSLDPTSVVAGDIRQVNSTVTGATATSVTGSIRDFAPDIAGASIFVGPALFLLYIGFAISGIAAGLALAGLAGRQVRQAEALISGEPIMAVVAAFAGLIGIIVAGTIALVTIVGIPLGLGILVLVLPMLFLVGYLVAGIWVGDLILSRMSPNVPRERPYLAAVIGLLALGVLSIIPLVGGIISFVGFGAVVLLMWRVIRRERGAVSTAAQPETAPVVG